MLEKLIRSSAAVRVLGIVLFQDGLHLREIARLAAVSPYEAKRELDILHGMGVLDRKKRGNQLVFSRNEDCPFFFDLRNLYKKTEGVFAELRDALGNRDGVRFAFIFGSSARNEERPHSDIDLMVVGGITEGDLAKLIFAIQQKTGREINFILWSEAALEDKIAKKSQFLKNIMGQNLLWLAGDRDEFVRIAAKRPRPKG